MRSHMTLPIRVQESVKCLFQQKPKSTMRGIDSIEYAHIEHDKTQSLEIQIIKLAKNKYEITRALFHTTIHVSIHIPSHFCVMKFWCKLSLPFYKNQLIER